MPSPLGTQTWTVRKITHNDVLVRPGRNTKAAAPPFWRAEDGWLETYFANRIAELLTEADAAIEDNGWSDFATHLPVDEAAKSALFDFLSRQRRHTGRALPHRHHLLIEEIESAPNGAPGHQVVLHTTWGGSSQSAFCARPRSRPGMKNSTPPLRSHASDYCVVLVMAEAIPAEEILGLVKPADLERLLRKRLEASGFFGARFRECAGTALLVPRRRINDRLPLWVSRLRAQKTVRLSTSL